MNRKASLKPESPELNERNHHQPSSAPISHMQDRRKISKSGSETSYRNSAKPPSTPPPIIPKEDYPIPRAELSERRPKRRSESDMSDGFESGKEYIDKVFFMFLTLSFKFQLDKFIFYIDINF